ncbi:SHOCT domain-containing protein [Streptomyces sp. NPDC049887]|uniref:SHOCT domain-containing protein n=1 Tax=Streptomyces sp. NPDC049887 TaxID=3155654 RepID=UPI0034183671
MYWYGHGPGGWFIALMAVGTAAFLIVLLLGVYLLVRRTGEVGAPQGGTERRRASRADSPTRAEEILAERYAHGDIDDEEYRRRAETLRSLDGPAQQG